MCMAAKLGVFMIYFILFSDNNGVFKMCLGTLERLCMESLVGYDMMDEAV
jgi:hypothetical protein